MVLLFLSAASACIPVIMNCRPWIYWLFSGEIRGFFLFLKTTDADTDVFFLKRYGV